MHHGEMVDNPRSRMENHAAENSNWQRKSIEDNSKNSLKQKNRYEMVKKLVSNSGTCAKEQSPTGKYKGYLH